MELKMKFKAISRFISSGSCYVFLGLIALAIISYLTTRAFFGGKDFIYMQDTFLVLNPKFLSKAVPCVWKPLLAPGVAYVSSGYLFYSIFGSLLSSTGASASLVEQAYVFLLIFSTGTSFFYVITRVLKKNSLKMIIIAVIGALFYTFNIYTLSINWFFIENWTAYAIIFPLLFLVVYRVVVEKRNRLVPVLVFICISQVFAYGISGPFIVTSLFFVVMFVVLYNTITKLGIKCLLKELIILTSVVLIAAFPSLISSEFTTGLSASTFSPFLDNPREFMMNQSASTSLSNVFSLSGFNWLANVPHLYPWHSNVLLRTVLVLLTFGVVIFFFYYCAIHKRRNAFYVTLAAIALLTIFVMKGMQPPLGEITYFLVNTRFPPFLVLVNPYYFFGQISVFLYSFVLSIAAYEALQKRKRGDIH